MTVKNKLGHIKDLLSSTRINRNGSKLRGKYIIIESDDWGAIRTPSRKAWDGMSDEGLQLSSSTYRFDALASAQDLSKLFDLLSKYRGSDGNPAVITANTIVANPDFEKIEDSDFQDYHFEPFTETFKNYPEHEHNLRIWQQAIAEGYFKPQFHGREHLNIPRWMKELRSGNEKVLTSFRFRSTYSGYGNYSFMEAYAWDEKSQVAEHKKILNQGLDLFEKIFGYRSKSFIAPCYCWDPEIEETLFDRGVECIQGLRGQYIPRGGFENYEVERHNFWESNEWKMKYNIRNCFFEPSMSEKKDWVGSCLARVSNAFYWNKPAVITSHRLNYVGFIDQRNADRGLKLLDELLGRIIKKWPDVRFITTDQLPEIMNEG